MFGSRIIICTASAAASIGFGAEAAVRLVPQDYPTIQAGINAAQAGDIVLVADGVYTGEGNREISLLGKAVTLQSVNGPDATIIDIQATPQTWHNGFTLHMQETPATVIQGFMVRNGYSFDGAGIHLVNSSPTIRNCVFTQNHAACWGAAMFYDGNSNAVIENCVFRNNVCDADGGAVFGLNGAPIFTECLFVNNFSASSSGAILTYGSTSPQLINSTVVGNSASFGSAIYSNNLKISNSIIWGNTGSHDAVYTFEGSSMEITHSIIQGGFEGEGNLVMAPQFIDAAAGDFHLASGSPGIDAGDPAMKDTPGEIDFDGDPRVFGSAVDMGIDEFRVPGDVSGDHAVNIDDLIAVMSAWGPCTWSTADLNSDSAVTVDDLLIVIMHWQ